jgi:hypothetical protein
MATNDKFGDERLVKNSGAAARASRDNADVDRVQQDGMSLSTAERRRQLREGWVQNVLPQVPQKPGWHRVWLSTTNSNDPIHSRIKVGYQPVRVSDVPGFEQYKIDNGQFEGCVACNEMILFEIPSEIYQDLMAIYHHDIPLEQEQGIRERVTGASRQDSEGRDLVSVEGDFNSLGRGPARAPHFA